MDVIKLNPVSPEGLTGPVLTDKVRDKKTGDVTVKQSFSDEIGNAVRRVDVYQKEADRAIEDGAIRGPEDIHEAMIRLQEAEISLRMFMQIRNKAIEAYREIMRMQV